MLDLIIIGSGPAGISAALTANKRNLNFLWFGNASLSKKIESAEKITNYPGLISVTGKQMKGVFQQQISEEGIILTEKRIDSVYDMGDYYVACVNESMYETKSVLMAVGMESTKELPGEQRLLGCGVSYCATCDGALYKNKKIAVICTNPMFEEEIEYLADITSEVILFTTYKECGVEKPNVKVNLGYPSEIIGDKRVEGIVFKGQRIDVDGVFLLKDSVSPGVLLKGLEMDNGHIRVDREQKTNLKGCFAAGDCTGRPYQYAKAVGEGNVAVHSIINYLNAQ
jgi:thioredoxin reductase (NADPH)